MGSTRVFGSTTAELSVELTKLFPGEDPLLKVAFFMDTFMSKLPADMKKLDIGNKEEILFLSGDWSDLDIVQQVIQEWLSEQKSSDTSNLLDALDEFDRDEYDPAQSDDADAKPSPRKIASEFSPVSTDVLDSPTPAVRKRGRPRKRKLSSGVQPNAATDEIIDTGSSSPKKAKETPSKKRMAVNDNLPEDATLPEVSDKLDMVNTEKQTDVKIEPEFIQQSEETTEFSYSTTEDGRYSCKECPFASIKLANLRQHVDRKHSLKRFRCPACPQTFGLKKAFSEHYSYYHKDHKFKCDQCDKTFPKNYLLKAHMDNHAKIITKDGEDLGNLHCKHCDFVAKKARYLQLHMMRLHAEKTLTCQHCDKKYSVDRDLKAHLKTHTELHGCDVCGKQLKSKVALESHIKVIHEGKPNDRAQKNYLCVTCGKLCRNKTVYTTHMNKAHLDVKPFDCSICGMQFFAKSNLKQHEMTHSDK